MNREFLHAPVMVDEVASLLAPVPSGTVLDATIGGAGHAAALLAARPDLSLIGLDRDPRAVEAATRRLEAFAGRARVVHRRFDELAEVCGELGLRAGSLSAAVFDLGVSSPQLDEPERGFSYQHAGPIDMRMDPTAGAPASDLVNLAPEQSLAELFSLHGEARFARRIAAAIVAHRPLSSTAELSEVVASAVPAAARRSGHPARRVFQALRAATNEELEQLAPALKEAISLLAPGGRILVLSYHSGEDRITKAVLAEAASGGCVCPPQLPCVCGAVPTVRLLTRGARLASAREIAANPRARSARLRGAERLRDAPTLGSEEA